MILTLNESDNLEKIFLRARKDYEQKRADVKSIIEDVRQFGDESVIKYTERFDGIRLNSDNICVSKEELDSSYYKVSGSELNAFIDAKHNIIEYNRRQLRETNTLTVQGKTTGYIIKPVERVGIYVPGGKAAYPSTVMMCALPAVVAGVKEIYMVTPGKTIHPLTLLAARECGVKKVFRIGGAQAIAAMAYGTETVPKVDVISGPGNIYVALAKREVYGEVGIDMIAGPSEILIIADDSADPEYIAADMLSQAEHDEMAVSMLITNSSELLEKVRKELYSQMERLSRKKIAEKAIENYGALVKVPSLTDAVILANKVAPEHLELCVKDSDKYLSAINNAGAIFVGNFSPEPLGDYYAGPNHVLPTGGTARYASFLGVDNYIKKISLIKYDESALKKASKNIISLAEAEGLQAHANAVRVRFKEKL